MSGHVVNRAARLEVQARIEVARHAGVLLRSKEDALGRERTRLVGHADRTAETWRRSCDEARVWLQRSRALGAGPEIAALAAHACASAAVDVRWQTAMGVVYPADVECRPEPTEGQSATAALGPTTEAFGRALEAGAAHASAQAALERLDRELGATRRRRRAIEQRLMPDLEASLHRLDVELDERDREAAVRGRLAAARSGEGRP